MQKISRKKAKQKMQKHISSWKTAIALSKEDQSLILDSKAIYCMTIVASLLKINCQKLYKNNISKADVVLVNFTLFKNYDISIISSSIDIIAEICKTYASIIISVTPMEKCLTDYIRIDIYLGFN